jgi:RNA polymerase sigma-70 factor (ECF subfamily)
MWRPSMSDAGQADLRNAFRMLAAGRTEALETIWHTLARPLHGYAFALTADHDEADDILSDIIAKLLRSGWRLRWVRNPKAYLFAAVRNAARDSVQRRSRAKAVGLDPPLQGAVGDPTDALAVRAAVMALPEEQREAVVLHIWGGCTLEEIGHLTGVRAATATSRYRYGLAKLRRALGVNGNE